MAGAETIAPPLEGEDPPAPAPAPSPPPPAPAPPASTLPSLTDVLKAQGEEIQRGLTEAKESAERSRVAREAELRIAEEGAHRLREKLAEPLPPLVQRQLIPPVPQRQYGIPKDLFGPVGSNGPGNQWIDTIARIGMIGGQSSRMGSMAAIGAMTSMLKAVNDNNDQAYKDALTTWRSEAERIRYNNSQEVATYNDILNRRDRSMRDIQQDTELAALGFHNRQIMEKARMGDLNGIANWIKMMETNIRDLEKAQVAVDRSTDSSFDQVMQDWWQGLTERPGQGGSHSAAWLQGLNRVERQWIAEKAAQLGVDNDEVYRRQKQAYDTRKAESARAVTAARTATRYEISAPGKAYERLSENAAGLFSYEITARRNFDNLIRTADKIGSHTNAQIINAVWRGVELQLNDPDTLAFYTALKAVQPEIARILANPRLVGTLTNQARNEAKEFLSAGMTSAAFRSVYNTLLIDFANRSDANNATMSILRLNLQRAAVGQPLLPLNEDTLNTVANNAFGKPPTDPNALPVLPDLPTPLAVPGGTTAPPPAPTPAAPAGPPPGAKKYRINPATGKLEEVP